MMPGDELHVIRWHAEPVRAAHHRRVALGLLAGIAFVVGLLVLRAWL